MSAPVAASSPAGPEAGRGAPGAPSRERAAGGRAAAAPERPGCTLSGAFRCSARAARASAAAATTAAAAALTPPTMDSFDLALLQEWDLESLW